VAYWSPVEMMTEPRNHPRSATQPLAEKTCADCGRPMSWRKAWAKNWDDVKYCSDKCRKRKSKAGTA
jgi:hypothetical protein